MHGVGVGASSVELASDETTTEACVEPFEVPEEMVRTAKSLGGLISSGVEGEGDEPERGVGIKLQTRYEVVGEGVGDPGLVETVDPVLLHGFRVEEDG